MSIQLTLEQEALIAEYREKWKQVALSTRRVDVERTKRAVSEAYALLDKPSPEIRFFESPYASLSDDTLLDLYESGSSFLETFTKELFQGITISQDLDLSPEQEERLISSSPWINRLAVEQRDDYVDQLKEFHKEDFGLFLINDSLSGALRRETRSFIFAVEHLLKELLGSDKFMIFEGEPRAGGQSALQCFCLQPEIWSRVCCNYDYEISVLEFEHDQRRWNVLRELICGCGWLIPYEDVCIVCERPISLELVSESAVDSFGYSRSIRLEFDGYSRSIRLEFEFSDGFGNK